MAGTPAPRDPVVVRQHGGLHVLDVLEQMLQAGGMSAEAVMENRAEWRRSEPIVAPPSPRYLRRRRAVLQMPEPYEPLGALPPILHLQHTSWASTFEPPPPTTARASSSFEPPPPATTGPASSSNEHLRGLEQREEGLRVPARLEMPLRSESPPQRKARRTG